MLTLLFEVLPSEDKELTESDLSLVPYLLLLFFFFTEPWMPYSLKIYIVSILEARSMGPST